MTQTALPHTLNKHGVSRHASRLRHILCPQQKKPSRYGQLSPRRLNSRRVLTSLPAFVTGARAQGLPLIRDAEIEALLQDYSKPIFAAAGFGGGRVTVRIVRNDAFNAFVVDGANVFINTGTLLQAKTPNEVIGVIAHESGHIAGGHMAALRARVAKDQTRALLTQILGIGAMVAGGVAGGNSGRDTMAGDKPSCRVALKSSCAASYPSAALRNPPPIRPG